MKRIIIVIESGVPEVYLPFGEESAEVVIIDRDNQSVGHDYLGYDNTKEITPQLQNEIEELENFEPESED